MKHILLSLLAVGFTACGTTNSDSKETIVLSIKCNSTNDTTNYQLLQSGDIISKSETLYDGTSSNPQIKIFHSEDGIKKVCLKSGIAIITR